MNQGLWFARLVTVLDTVTSLIHNQCIQSSPLVQGWIREAMFSLASGLGWCVSVWVCRLGVEDANVVWLSQMGMGWSIICTGNVSVNMFSPCSQCGGEILTEHSLQMHCWNLTWLWNVHWDERFACHLSSHIACQHIVSFCTIIIRARRNVNNHDDSWSKLFGELERSTLHYQNLHQSQAVCCGCAVTNIPCWCTDLHLAFSHLVFQHTRR